MGAPWCHNSSYSGCRSGCSDLICSEHSIQSKHDDSLSPDYVPSLFRYLESPAERMAAQDLTKYKRNTAKKRKK